MNATGYRLYALKYRQLFLFLTPHNLPYLIIQSLFFLTTIPYFHSLLAFLYRCSLINQYTNETWMGIAVTWQSRRDTGGSSGSVVSGDQPTSSAGSSSSKKKGKNNFEKNNDFFLSKSQSIIILFNFFHKHVQIHHLYTFYASYGPTTQN